MKDDLIEVWSKCLKDLDWEPLVEGVEPKPTGCGLVYEVESPLNRPNESFAIADMRGLYETEPHFHLKEHEIYFVLQGTGIVCVGGVEYQVRPGDAIPTPPHTAHFTVPNADLVLGVVNSPPFRAENYVALGGSDPKVGFDSEQYRRLNRR